MNTFGLLFQIVIAFVAVSCQQQYVQQQYLGPYSGPVGQYEQQALDSQSGAAASASASSGSQNSLINNNGQLISGPVTGPGVLPIAGPVVGSPAGPIYGPPAVPIDYTAVDPKSHNSHVSESFHSNKGEILIHRPAPIIVKRPPTKVLVNHPPLVVKPAPVVLHKPPPVIMRKVFVKEHPRPVKVEPVYVNVVKPPAEKYYVKEKVPQLASGVAYNQIQRPVQYQIPAQYLGSQLQQQLNSQSQAQAHAEAQAQTQQQELAMQSAQLQYPQGVY